MIIETFIKEFHKKVKHLKRKNLKSETSLILI